MSAVLEEGGYEVHQLSRSDEWQPGVGGIGVVAELNDETALESVRTLSDDHPYIPIVAITDQPTLATYAAQWVSTDEADWLRAMAAGATVAEIAVDVGYSERAMFRNLKALYTRIGARNRTEALLWASRHGLLTA